MKMVCPEDSEPFNTITVTILKDNLSKEDVKVEEGISRRTAVILKVISGIT